MDKLLKTIKTTVSMLVTLFPATLLALANFPHGCRVSGVRFSQGNAMLFSQHTAKPRLYVIHAISKHAIWLTHQDFSRAGSAGWAAGWGSSLSPHCWSALLVTQKNFSLSCHDQQKSGHGVKLPCDQLIRICQYSDFYSKHPVGGGYWVAENLAQNVLELHIRQRGFVLRK